MSQFPVSIWNKFSLSDTYHKFLEVWGLYIKYIGSDRHLPSATRNKFFLTYFILCLLCVFYCQYSVFSQHL